MKNIIVILIALCSILGVNNTFAQDKSDGKESITQAENTDKEGIDSIKVVVEGLGCPFCAFGLEKKFKEVAGIEDIGIEMETGVMTFIVPSVLDLSAEEITERVKKAGYTAVDVAISRAKSELDDVSRAAVPQATE